MNWTRFLTYGDSYQEAFETLCDQLFERYLRRKYGNDLIKFRVINGAGGDGGIEAYGELKNGDFIAVQAKWFREVLGDGEIRQIRKSVTTAMSLRNNIKEYIICVPRDINSLKFGRGAKGAGHKPIENYEEKAVDDFTDEIESTHPNLNITWWFEQDIELQIQEGDNEGLHKFWFERELISMAHLVQQFDLQKKAWIEKRYIPELHGQGVIQNEIQQLLFNQNYRKELINDLETGIRTLETAVDLIGRFAQTLEHARPLHSQLIILADEININLSKICPLSKAITEGVNSFPMISFTPMTISEELLVAIEAIRPIDRQLGVQERLINALTRLKYIDLQQLVGQAVEKSNQTGRLFLGNAGTGKTHALANTVDVRLHTDLSPAIIIRAKGTPCSDWSQILRKALELDGWDRRQILSALETLAIRGNHREASKLNVGEELKREPVKVMICIDGLEEDTIHWSDWYERMRESVELMGLYPRVRFAFTARNYFFNKEDIPQDSGFKVIEIPMEGDVPVSSVIEQYFSPEHFNIEVQPKSLIRGIDSLYALRLFCELYQGQMLTNDSEILTAERDLLNEKINRIEADFRKIKDAGTARKPIREAIGVLSDAFYQKAEIEHDELFSLLQTDPLSYLEKENIDQLIGYLVNNGFLIKSELPTGTGMLTGIKVIYNLTYQSTMELIMSEKYAAGIVGGELKALPAVLLTTSNTKHPTESNGQLVNERIVQYIVNKLFHDYGLLIGQEDFLTEGLEQSIVHKLQVTALIQAPTAVGEAFKANIDELFFRDHKSRSFVFSNLIYPSAASAGNFFGAEYLHDLLMKQKTAFEREKVWLGWDRLDIQELGKEVTSKFHRYDLRNSIDPYGEGNLHLPEFSLHNEYPLIYAWALTTLDQSLRERLRVALTEWAIQQPLEFRLLLEKIFNRNDPQIQEDLASITLGLASKLKDKESLGQIARWALTHVFADLTNHRNVIVRAGFRAMVEKAFAFGAIASEEAEMARPHVALSLQLIPVDQLALKKGTEEIYPVVHDLAWYVIKRAFNDFLEYETVTAGDESRAPSTAFLKSYLDELRLDSLSTYGWAISAAIAYMKSLGFSRTQESGNGYTDATHGAKSKNFTLEEKYTWLAVHYLQGYLSDYLPLEKNGQFIQDYMAINHIPNPAESLDTRKHPSLPDIEENWIIKESLAPEIHSDGTPDEQIKAVVENEPVINFDKWLEFKEKEFRTNGTDEEWLALFNYTTVHDSREYISSSIDARGIIVEKGQVPALLDLLRNHPRRTNFVAHIDNMVGLSDTDTYSNPSDIVWMTWIEEIEFEERYYLPPDGEEKTMLYTVTSVTKNTVEGEEEIYIPSKIVRMIMDITEMDNEIFLDKEGQVVGINHILKRPNYDRQEITLVRKKELLERLNENEKEIVWFVDLYRAKNALNDTIKSDNHPMKTRKYLVWYNEGKLVAEKFWDARFSNQRDKAPGESEEEDND